MGAKEMVAFGPVNHFLLFVSDFALQGKSLWNDPLAFCSLLLFPLPTAPTMLLSLFPTQLSSFPRKSSFILLSGSNQNLQKENFKTLELLFMTGVNK